MFHVEHSLFFQEEAWPGLFMNVSAPPQPGLGRVYRAERMDPAG